jgi:hypothetical protein
VLPSRYMRMSGRFGVRTRAVVDRDVCGLPPIRGLLGTNLARGVALAYVYS